MPDDAPSLKYRREEHRARYTQDYVFSQLIPYIGNKRKLLPFLVAGLDGAGEPGAFVDLFTGSTVVARMAKERGWQVLANDWEPYSAEIAHGTVVQNQRPAFAGTSGLRATFETLNQLSPLTGWVTTHLCPRRDDQADPARERMFFTRENGQRIDAIRTWIEMHVQNGRLTSDERSYLLAALLYSACYVSNTSGVFKAYHAGWGGATGTALYRILSRLELTPPILQDNQKTNFATCLDAAEAAARSADLLGRKPDVIYLDPPYNQHPYGSNYHLLNTLVLWDEPELSPEVLQNGKPVDKAAIRRDWRERRSAFNHSQGAAPEFERVLDACAARYVLVSYSTDALVPPHTLLGLLGRLGKLSLRAAPYKRYRVSSQRPSSRPHTIEYLITVEAGRPSSSRAAQRLVDELEGSARSVASGETSDE